VKNRRHPQRLRRRGARARGVPPRAHQPRKGARRAALCTGASAL